MDMKRKKKLPCLCYSGRLYGECCEPYHSGLPATNGLILMRTRFCAYAMGRIDYILATTAPHSSHRNDLAKDLIAFCQNTQFLNLEVLDFVEEGCKACVTFQPTLKQQGQIISYLEKSSFDKIGERWFYVESE